MSTIGIKTLAMNFYFFAFKSWHLKGTEAREQTAPIILETQPHIWQKNHCLPSLSTRADKHLCASRIL